MSADAARLCLRDVPQAHAHYNRGLAYSKRRKEACQRELEEKRRKEEQPAEEQRWLELEERWRKEAKLAEEQRKRELEEKRRKEEQPAEEQRKRELDEKRRKEEELPARTLGEKMNTILWWIAILMIPVLGFF
jgi:hypothetical protein